jgi:hypothetical protein
MIYCLFRWIWGNIFFWNNVPNAKKYRPNGEISPNLVTLIQWSAHWDNRWKDPENTAKRYYIIPADVERSHLIEKKCSSWLILLKYLTLTVASTVKSHVHKLCQLTKTTWANPFEFTATTTALWWAGAFLHQRKIIILKTRHAISCAVIFYNAGIVN